MSNFRVVVQLHSFFSDVRSSSRVYITSEIKTVEHLKTHISELFDLAESFYLISNNLYLPECEDVRILKEDDVVVAIREDASHTKVRNKRKVKPHYDEPECETLKRKSAGSCTNHLGGINIEFSSTPLKKKKKQKHKSRESEEKQGNEDDAKTPKYDNMDVDGENYKSTLKNVKSAVESNNYRQDATDDAGKGELKKSYENATSTKTNSEICNDDRYSLWCFKDAHAPFHTISASRLQKPVVTSKKEIKPIKISTEPKLIKSIVVSSLHSNGASESENNTNKKIVSIKRTYENESFKCNINNKISNGTGNGSDTSYESRQNILEQKENKELKNNILETKQSLFQTQNLFVNVNSQETSSTSIADLLPHQFIAQPKNRTLNGSEKSFTPTTDVLPPQCNAQTENKSINGSENNEEEECTDDTENTFTEESSRSSLPLKRKRKRIRKRKPKFVEQESVYEAPTPKPIFTTAAPPVHIRFDYDEHKQTDHVEPEPALHSELDDVVNYEKLCKEEISKFPIMMEIFPKKGDIIAFKICKLSTAYTPEISDFIIAKVIEYSSTSKNTLLHILEGIDNFAVPEGKFFMDDCAHQNERGERQICWNELLEPRLLFP